MLDYRVEDHVAWLTLNRPEKHNALSLEFWSELPEATTRAQADSSVRVVILHGQGRSFSAGADLDVLSGIERPQHFREFLADVNKAMRSLESLTKPVIAAVHGYVFGGGCELTILSDIVIADETAKLALPEVKAGILPGPGMVRGISLMGAHVLKYMLLTGEAVDAQEARAAGLVNVVTPPGQHTAEAARIAGVLAARPPLALSVAKGYVNSQYREDYGYAMDALSFLRGTSDAVEGVTAFRERRQPRFQGN